MMLPESRTEDRSDRGSAILVAVMVTAVLALMGLAFLTLSETETYISINRRNTEQVLSIAESGVNLAVTWYNNPDSVQNELVPPLAAVDLDQRVGDTNWDGVDDIDVASNGPSDRYRGGRASGGYRLFDRFYRGPAYATLWGDSDHPDVLIQDDPATPGEYLDEVNALFNPSNDPSLGTVRISEIKVYAPPMDTALRQRFGIATIEVTAVKHERGPGSDIAARQTVRAVLNEIPFPVPIGALEAAAPIDESGNFGTHWAGTSTESTLDTTSGSNYPGPTVPRASSDLDGWEDFAPNAPDLDLLTAGTQNLLTQLMAWSPGIPDPWILFRANGELADAPGNPDEQPWPYDYFDPDGLDGDRSFMFAHQSYTFPEADYDVWKEIAQMPLPNVHYFCYAGLGGGGDPLFREDCRGTSRKAQEWVNLEYTATGVDPGIFFFDTANQQSPQNGGGGVLTPGVNWSSGDIVAASGDFFAAGFIFMNSEFLETSGLSSKGRDIDIHPPSEPFLDEGIDLNHNSIVGDTQEELETVGNGWWDFDIDDDGVNDGDEYNTHYGSAAWTTWASSHEFAAGVLPHAGADPRKLLSRPHEAFLNLGWRDYPEKDYEIPVDFDFEATFTRTIGTDINNDGIEDETTTLWDVRGAKLLLERCNLSGVLYNEGAYDGSGNMNVYGSVFFRDGFVATGSPDVWFNAEIYRGNFPFSVWDLPRVYVSAMTFDDE